MTEDDTYKKLKGLSRKEALEMFNFLYRIGIDSSDTNTMYDVRKYVDERLRAYGWSCDMLDDGRE